MVAIKDFGIPSYCVNCDMCTSDNPSPNDENRGYCHVTQKSITNIYDEQPSDCPLVEIGNCKDCVKGHKYKNLDECFCDYLQDDVDTDFYCAEFKKRGSEE